MKKMCALIFICCFQTLVGMDDGTNCPFPVITDEDYNACAKIIFENCLSQENFESTVSEAKEYLNERILEANKILSGDYSNMLMETAVALNRDYIIDACVTLKDPLLSFKLEFIAAENRLWTQSFLIETKAISKEDAYQKAENFSDESTGKLHAECSKRLATSVLSLLNT